MGVDHRQLMWEEVDDIGALLHELPDDEFDRPSLCEGRRVRDILGHMLYGHTTPMRSIMGTMVRYRGDVDRGSFEQSIAYASARTPSELRDRWDEALVHGRQRRGIAKVIRSGEGFLDHLIHQQDIRRPVDRPREIPADRLVAALDLVPRVQTPFFGTKKVVAGLRLEATDADWSHGDGPTVAGPGEALILAAAGRAVALADLDGDGVGELAARVASPVAPVRPGD